MGGRLCMVRPLPEPVGGRQVAPGVQLVGLPSILAPPPHHEDHRVVLDLSSRPPVGQSLSTQFRSKRPPPAEELAASLPMGDLDALLNQRSPGLACGARQQPMGTNTRPALFERFSDAFPPVFQRSAEVHRATLWGDEPASLTRGGVAVCAGSGAWGGERGQDESPTRQIRDCG